MPAFKVASIQACPIAYDLAASLHKLERLVAEAAGKGAKLVVLPEAFLTAYPRFLGFVIGKRTPEAREWYRKYVESSVLIPTVGTGKDIEGEEYGAFRTLASIARYNKVFLSVGIIERSETGSTLWCTNIVLSNAGVLLSRHRKLQPTGAERVIWSQGEGVNRVGGKGGKEEDNLPVVKTAVGKLGGLICWENFMPMARYLLYKKGVEVYLAPTADARPTWLPTMQHIAQEGRCFVISANQFHAAGDFPADYPSVDAPEESWSRGGSCIVGPLGEVLAGPLWDEEGIIYAEIDIDQLHGAKLDFDPVGHYAREDLVLGLLNAECGR